MSSNEWLDPSEGTGRIPRPSTPLIGRAAEADAVLGMLRRGDTRLVTLVGPGGVGKTRLAIRVAEEAAAAFPDGVTFVPLASIGDPALVAPVIAKALGAPDIADLGCPDVIVAFLRERRVLLVLDNIEHLLDATDLITKLLSSTANLTVLVTSRVVLRLSGERVFSVRPLDLPDAAAKPAPGRLADNDAVRLFMERAQAVRPELELTDETAPAILTICRLLDGLPLAIELAAARSNVLAPQALASRLERRLALLTGGPRDLPVRQQTMRGTIAWSYDLLPPEEQQLFQRLAVFVGGFSLEAAEAVAGGEEGRRQTETVAPPAHLSALPPVLDGIASLVDKSLIRAVTTKDGSARFAMLETIREYGLERLEESGELAAVRAAHESWYFSLADKLWTRYVETALDAELLNEFELEHDNLRALLGRLDQENEPGRFVDLAGKLAPFWRYHSHFTEGRRWLERGLVHAGAAGWEPRARIEFGAGLIALYQADYGPAGAHMQRSLALWRERGHGWGVGTSLLALGLIARAQGAFTEAATLLTDSLTEYERIGTDYWMAVAVRHLGEVAYALGDTARAMPLLCDGLEWQRRLNDPMGLATALDSLAMVAIGTGDEVQAAERLAESLDRWLEVESKEGLSDWLARVATLAERRGEHTVAIRLYEGAQTLATSVGHTARLPERSVFERGEQAARARLTEARYEDERRAGAGHTLDQALDEARGVLSRVRMATPAEQRVPPDGLSEREAEVLALAAAGLSNAEIADRLFLSPHTVRAHLHRIYAKLEIGTRAEAVRYAIEHGIG